MRFAAADAYTQFLLAIGEGNMVILYYYIDRNETCTPPTLETTMDNFSETKIRSEILTIPASWEVTVS